MTTISGLMWSIPPGLKERAKVVTAWIGLWFLLTLVGFSLYGGLRLLGMMPTSLGWWRGFLAAAALAAGLAILLGIDKSMLARDPSLGQEAQPKSLAALLFLLLARRPALLAFMLHGLIVLSLVSYYVFKSLVTVERAGYGFTIRLPGQTVHLYPVHPYGWQNTGITFDSGSRFTVELTGRVSTGYLHHVAEREEFLAKLVQWSRDPDPKKAPPPTMPPLVEWPFTGPNGYGSDFYAANAKEVAPYTVDPWLTVRGLPHNAVIGLIVGKGQPACGGGLKLDEPCRARIDGSVMKPGYVFGTDPGLMHFREELSTYTAERTGELWIVINDADEARWDNSGMFFLKVTVKE